MTRIWRGENQLILALVECGGFLMDWANRLTPGYLTTDQHFAGVIFKNLVLLNDSVEFKVTRDRIRNVQESQIFQISHSPKFGLRPRNSSPFPRHRIPTQLGLQPYTPLIFQHNLSFS